MKKRLSFFPLFAIFAMTAMFILSVPSGPTPLYAGLHWQSALPTPKDTRPRNEYFIRSSEGGRIWCGLQQSSVWLDIPAGYSPEGGAEFRCDPTDNLAQAIGASASWDDRGYLIGFWPSTMSILKPVSLVFELDPVRVSPDCTDCFVVRYYDAGHDQWHSLPTKYNGNSARVYSEFSENLPSSGYPAYEDRFLIALFERSKVQPTSTPTAQPSPTLTLAAPPTHTPSVVPSLVASLSPTETETAEATPSLPAPTLTVILPSAVPSLTPSVSPTEIPATVVTPPSLSPAVTAISPSPTIDSSPTPSVAPTAASPEQPFSNWPTGAWLAIVALLLVIIVLLIVLLISLYKKR